MNHSGFKTGWYNGNLEWFEDSIIFLTKHGSQSYGTNLPTSDTDYKGVCISPRDYVLGFNKSFEQVEHKGDPDAVVYDIRKFFKLAANCNPNIIEMLFVDESDWVYPNPLEEPSPLWMTLVNHRDMFLSKKAKFTFSGYAMSQLNRIKTHRNWLLNPPAKHPERSDYGLPNDTTLGKDQFGVIESKVCKLEDKLGGRGFTKDRLEEVDMALVVEATKGMDLNPNLIPLIHKERQYNGAMRNWVAYEKWKEERNPARAALEAKHGYDTKHAMHLVRLMRMATEILSTGKVLVKRPDAEELLEIRAGAWSFEDLMFWADGIEKKLDELYLTSTLPHSADIAYLDELCVNMVEYALFR